MGAYMGLYEISFCCVVSGTQIDAIMKTEDRDLFSKVPETLARDVVTTNVSMVTGMERSFYGIVGEYMHPVSTRVWIDSRCATPS